MVLRLELERREFLAERVSGSAFFRKAIVQEARWLQEAEFSVALYVWMAPIVVPVMVFQSSRLAPSRRGLASGPRLNTLSSDSQRNFMSTVVRIAASFGATTWIVQGSSREERDVYIGWPWFS